ncbi:MAG: hypothetical protein WCF18_25880, partial [Chthoniobacteraceae bacterium]
LSLALLFLAGRGWALEVRETRWGFDGKVVPGRLNLVSVLISNPGQATFDGVITLRETTGVGGGSGAPIVQPIFLSARSERWVQFAAFINAGYENFEIEWGRGSREHHALMSATAGPPARVLLIDASNPFASGGGLKVFPDALFPTAVAATDGLDSVVLDYVPRWEAARREAFGDWVRRGGKVIVLPGANGQFPQFTEQLAALNISGTSAHVGAGTVLRVAAARRDAGERLFAEHGFPMLELKQGSPAVVYNLEQSLFQRLAQLTRPKIRWWLINSLTALYILVVGPAHYRWARRIDYRLSIGAFVGCVGVFGFLFAAVGRRGYDEAQTVHSLSIARAIEPGRHDVTQWISAFATRGDLYRLTHLAPSNLYATVSSEKINGQIINGKDGQFIADIPQYSSRQFVHRAVMPGAETSVTVENLETGVEVLKSLVLKTGPAFPRDTIEIRARYREHFYLMERKGDRLELSANERGQTFAAFLPQAAVQQAMNTFSSFAPGEEMATRTNENLRATLPLLYLRALDGRDFFSQGIDRGPQPADQLQLFIFMKSPESFRLQGEGFGGETGYVLYVQEVWKP